MSAVINPPSKLADSKSATTIETHVDFDLSKETALSPAPYFVTDFSLEAVPVEGIDNFKLTLVLKSSSYGQEPFSTSKDGVSLNDIRELQSRLNNISSWLTEEYYPKKDEHAIVAGQKVYARLFTEAAQADNLGDYLDQSNLGKVLSGAQDDALQISENQRQHIANNGSEAVVDNKLRVFKPDAA